MKSSIKAVYERHKGRYGYRRITAELRHAGQAVNHKTVQRLMSGLGLKSLVRPKRYRSYQGELASSPNVLDRQFDAVRPNEKWVTDVTEFRVRGAKLYLSPVMDLYNGEIVTFEMQERPLDRMSELPSAFAARRQPCLAKRAASPRVKRLTYGHSKAVMILAGVRIASFICPP